MTTTEGALGLPVQSGTQGQRMIGAGMILEHEPAETETEAKAERQRKSEVAIVRSEEVAIEVPPAPAPARPRPHPVRRGLRDERAVEVILRKTLLFLLSLSNTEHLTSLQKNIESHTRKFENQEIVFPRLDKN